MIDNSEEKKPKDEIVNCVYKDRFLNTSRIKNENIFNNKNKGIKNLITQNFGGLSEVWGSAINEVGRKEKSIYKNLGIELDPYFKILNEKLNFLSNENNSSNNTTGFPANPQLKNYYKLGKKNKKINVAFSRFLVSKDTEYEEEICEICGSFTFLCKNESLWSTKKEFKKFISSNKIQYLRNHQLLSFKENEKGVECSIQYQKKNLNLNFDYVFIGAGAFATSEIFLKSNLIDKVVIENSDAISIPFVKKTNVKKNRTSHPLLFLHHEIEENLFFSQIYFYSDNLLKIFLGNSILTNLLSYVPTLIKNFFGGARIFLDPKLSSKIELKYSDGKVSKKIIENEKSNYKSPFNKHLKTYKSIGFYSLKILSKKLSNGESYHFGSQFKHSNNSGKEYSDRLGRVGGLKKIHIIDSSVLPIVNTGPITYTVMANSLRISDEFLNILDSK